MSKLVIKGSDRYVERMFRHLHKEHPSTKKRMSIHLSKAKKKIKRKIRFLNKENADFWIGKDWLNYKKLRR